MSVSHALLFILAAGSAAAAPAASVTPTEVEAQLAKMLVSTGHDYLAARAALLEMPKDVVLPVLTAKKARASWKDESWKDEAIVDAALLWVQNPTLAKKPYALSGIDPAQYGLRRRPDPEVGRELKSMKAAAPILLEIELKTLEVYPFISSGAAQTKEHAALLSGLMIAIASSRHPAAVQLLKMKLEDDAQPVFVRRLAALGLGQLGGMGAFGLIAPIAQNRTADVSLRGGAIAGLGQLRTPASFEVLARLASGNEGAEIRGPAIASLGTLGNTWVLRRSKNVSAEALREKTSRALVAILASDDGAHWETQLEEAMVMIAHPVLRSELTVLSAETSAPELRARAQRALARLDLAARRDS